VVATAVAAGVPTGRSGSPHDPHRPPDHHLGLAVEFFALLPDGPRRDLLPVRRSIITVDRPVGAGKPNQETNVLLVRFLLNLVTALDGKWRERFKTPLPHDKKFDAELGRRVRAYQEAGGFQMPGSGGGDNPPTPVIVTAFLKGDDVGAGPAVADAPSVIKEDLFVDGVIDPCRSDSDRGSRSKLVYAIDHLNYHLLVRLKATQTMRLAPSLLAQIDLLKDPNLAPLRAELEIVERNDPDKTRPNPKPQPGPVIA
jgi:hypothetical protein